MRITAVALAAGLIMLSTSAFAEPYSHGPKQTGEVVLEELLAGKNSLIVKVDSNGCTGKASFRVDSRKVEGITPLAPHYILTINRITPDECKAIVDAGTLIVWDLEKDLGLKGNFTFSVSNTIYSVRPFQPDDEDSLIGIIERYFSFGPPQIIPVPDNDSGKAKH